MIDSGVQGTALLDQCITKLRELGERIDRRKSLSGQYIAPTAPPNSPATSSLPSPTPSSCALFVIDSILLPAVMSTGRAPSRCHECHGPLSGYHKGYPHGVDVCELQHYELCPGDIQEGSGRGGQFWRGCPGDFEPPESSGMTENGGNNSDVDWIYSGFSKEDNSDAASSKDSDVFVKPVSKPSESSHQESKDLEKLSADNFAPSSTAGGQNEDLLLEAEMAELKIMEERNNKLEDVRKRKQQAQEQFKRLSQNNQAAGASSVENIQYNAEQLRTNNREQSQSKVGKTGYQGPSIGEMRKNHYTSERVEDMMTHVKDIPAFSNARDLPHQHPQLHPHPQPRLKNRHQTDNVEDRSRRPYHQSPSSAPEEPLYRMMTKTDKYGVEYRELVRVSPPRPEPQQRQRLVVDGDNGWSYDQHTGCMYRTGQGYQSPNHTAVNNGSWRPGSNCPQHHAIQTRGKVE